MAAVGRGSRTTLKILKESQSLNLRVLIFSPVLLLLMVVQARNPFSNSHFQEQIMDAIYPLMSHDSDKLDYEKIFPMQRLRKVSPELVRSDDERYSY
jgi:hypothetical protein